MTYIKPAILPSRPAWKISLNTARAIYDNEQM